MQMKKQTYFLLLLLFVASSCYIYKPYDFKEDEKVAQTSNRLNSERSIANQSQFSGGSQIDRRNTEINEKEEARKMKEEMRNSNDQSATFLSSKTQTNEGKNESEAVNNEIISNKSTPESTDSLKIKIQPNKYYKISAEGKQYKIQADQWEGDTLVSHILRKPEKVLRFHSNQIEEELLMERRFSKPFSDLITVGAYVVGGVAVLLLVL